MEQLILHGIGDFFIQTDKWALNKKKKGSFGLWCCFIHCLTYSLSFLMIGSPLAVLAIFLSHFAIDRTNGLAYVLAWKNKVTKTICIKHNDDDYMSCHQKISRNCIPKTLFDISNFGFRLDKPFAISIWLYIITDNLLHIICNYLALKYL